MGRTDGLPSTCEVGEERPAGPLRGVVADVEKPESDEVDADGPEAR